MTPEQIEEMANKVKAAKNLVAEIDALEKAEIEPYITTDSVRITFPERCGISPAFIQEVAIELQPFVQTILQTIQARKEKELAELN